MTLSVINYIKQSAYSSYEINNDVKQDSVEDKKNVIQLKTINNNILYISYSNNSDIINPSISFSSPHTFLKSYLYLTHVEFNKSVDYSLKSDIILKRYLKSKVNKESEKKLIGVKATFYRKLVSDVDFDTDPDKNIYFSKFIDLILDDKKEDFIIIRCGKNGLCEDTVPYKIPRNSVTKNKRLKKYYVFLMKYDGLFAPYGMTYSY